jgi:hypothetical protein
MMVSARRIPPPSDAQLSIRCGSAKWIIKLCSLIVQRQGEARENVTILPKLNSRDVNGDNGIYQRKPPLAMLYAISAMLASQRSGRGTSMALVDGRAKRRGPALPGLT